MNVMTGAALPRKITKTQLCKLLGFTYYGSERPNYQCLYERVLTPQYCIQNDIRIGRHKEFDVLETEKIFDLLRSKGYKLEKLINQI